MIDASKPLKFRRAQKNFCEFGPIHGDFPNRGNPNTIRAQSYTFRMPANPQMADSITPLGMNPFGVAINGVPFDPGAAEWWNNDPGYGWQYEALSGKINLGMDQNHAHVQPNGAYHYHGLPTGLITQLGDGQRMILIGYAADGFPIYEQYGYKLKDIRSDIIKLRSSYRLKPGRRPNKIGPGGPHDGTFVEDYEYVEGGGDLDECNGRTGVTPEYLSGTYYYVITSEFPFIPRCYRGTPDESFRRRGPGPGGPRGRPQDRRQERGHLINRAENSRGTNEAGIISQVGKGGLPPLLSSDCFWSKERE